MSFSGEEVEKLKQCLTEILDERFFSPLHELKKKLAIATSKEEQNATKLADYERELQTYKVCHDCHRLNVDTRDFTCQVTEVELAEATTKPSNRQPDLRNGHKNKEPRLEVNLPVTSSTIRLELHPQRQVILQPQVQSNKQSDNGASITKQFSPVSDTVKMAVDQPVSSQTKPKIDADTSKPEIIEISSSEEM